MTPTAEPIPVATPLPRLPVARPARRSAPRRLFAAAGSAFEYLLGLAAVCVGLAVLAAIPVVQFLTLGYLLEASGRAARTGRLRDGLIGVRPAARLGGMVFAAWVLLLPVRYVADVARSAQIIDPGSRAAAGWRLGLLVLTAATFVHIAAAAARGGRVRHFLNPFNVFWLARRVLRGGYYAEARDAVWNTVVGLRLPHYFVLGLKGFAVGFAWLVLPVTLLAVGRGPTPGDSAVGFAGAVLLGVVVLYLPFLQARLGMTNRWRDGFAVRAVRADFRRAPWAFAAALVAVLLSAVPLYLLKIEVIPREAGWLPAAVFIVFMLPARLLVGWAVGRAGRRAGPRHWLARWLGRVPLLPAAAVYVLIVFLSQYTSWNGVAGLYEQHAFLLPVPLLGG